MVISISSEPLNIAELFKPGFSILELPKENLDYLNERFKYEKNTLDDLLKFLDNDPINDVNHPGMRDYISIPAKRLGSILTSVAKYDCGKGQLIQLANELKTNKIKLKFVQPQRTQDDQDEYAFLSSKSLVSNLTIYVAVQPEGPISNPNGRWVCKYTHSGNKLKKFKLDEKRDFMGNLSLEGYKCGHELSHAIAFVRFYKSRNFSTFDIEVSNAWGGFHNGTESSVNRNVLDFLPRLSKKKKDIIWDMFSTPEEYRNVLGLGISKLFSDEEGIIGEFEYLNELMADKNNGAKDIKDVIYVRMPYNPGCWNKDIALEICKQKYKQEHPLNSDENIKNCGICNIV